MTKNTFKIYDNLYKKLIKLPTGYYRLKQDDGSYILDSHIGTIEIENINDIKLRKKDDKIVLHKGSSPLKVKKNDKEEDFVIQQEDIIGADKDQIIKSLEEKKSIDVTLKSTSERYSDFSIGLSLYRTGQLLNGELKSINFYDENDPILQNIKKKTGGLYFTIKDDNSNHSKTIYISDKGGEFLSGYDDYQYQYEQSQSDVLTIDEIINVLKRANNPHQKSTLQKGENLSEDIYEANIALNDKPIATLPKIGYYMFDDQLIMRNHVTQEEVVIPRDFHYLKAIKFNSGDYKLTFCNSSGNEFFEYKKYDPQYSNTSDEYKFISLNCAKKEYNPNLCELFSYWPSFFIAKGDAEPGSPSHYLANVFELTSSGEGRKMATLIDEFGYFNEAGHFKYCDYHKEIECRVYHTSQINQDYRITDINSEFFLTGDKNVTLHTIPELF